MKPRVKPICFKFCIPSADNTNVAFDSIRSLLYDEHDYEVVMNCFNNNKKPLSVLYNECIAAAIADDTDWLVLCHNDLIVESNNLLERILQPKFDVVGLAGADNLQLKSPALWHLMAIPGSHRGAVAHNTANNTKHVTAFGPYPARCVIIDGLFLAINKKVFHEHRFDEENPAGFHFYDLDFTLGAHHRGFKCGVGDILVTHQSPGLKEFTPEWTAGEKWFLNKHNK